MDLKDFEDTFSAYQRKEMDTGSVTTMKRRSILDRPKELSVIDSKRAQNCSIVLSNLKMTDAEVHLKAGSQYDAEPRVALRHDALRNCEHCVMVKRITSQHIATQE